MSLFKNSFSDDQLSQPVSGKWLNWLAIVSFLMLPVAVAGYRFNFYQFSVALVLLGASLLVAAISFLGASFVILKHRNSNSANSQHAQRAMYISLIPLLFLGSQVITAKSVPMIHNISTDIIDPPQFNKIIAMRGSVSNPHEYDANLLADIQRAAYPEIKTLTVLDSFDVAFNKSLLLIEELGWELISADKKRGVIEASQTTKLWGFTDDIVVRIAKNNDKSDIDLHSVSRVGRSDLGANAKRIQSFVEAYIK